MKRIWAVLAVVAVFGVMLATPASAEARPVNGKLDLEFYGPTAGCEVDGYFRTWVGTAEIGGATYGWADFAPGPPQVDGKFLYFVEYWTVFSLDGVEETDSDAIAAAACSPDRVLIDGTNTGWATPAATAKAEGEVLSATGPFEDVQPGARMFWRGKVLDEAFTQFKATLHIRWAARAGSPAGPNAAHDSRATTRAGTTDRSRGSKRVVWRAARSLGRVGPG